MVIEKYVHFRINRGDIVREFYVVIIQAMIFLYLIEDLRCMNNLTDVHLGARSLIGNEDRKIIYIFYSLSMTFNLF
jgi:hypothetical protein